MKQSISLDELLSSEAATAHLSAAGVEVAKAEPTYIRHKPGETTIVAFRFTLPDASHTWGYAHWCMDPRRADEIYSKATTLRPRPSAMGAGLSRLDPHTVLYAFPNDARLRQLRWYTNPRKLKRSLQAVVGPEQRLSKRRTSVSVLRYKPERRVVAKLELGTADGLRRPLVLRYSTKQQASQLASISRHLLSHGVAVPAPVAQLEDGRVCLDEFIEGNELRGEIRLGRGDEVPSRAKQLANALSAFHATPPPLVVERRTPLAELAHARQGLLGLASFVPDLDGVARALTQKLVSELPVSTSREVLVHGDLHAKNILVDRDDMTFVDLERVAVGPAAIDLGCFRAHAIALGIRQPGWSPTALEHADATIDRYRSHAGSGPPPAVPWHTAIGLIDQALLVVRHLEDRWPTTSAQLLDAAMTQVGRPAVAAHRA